MHSGYQPEAGAAVPKNPPSGGSSGQREPEIRYLGDLQRLTLKPGDKLVLSIDAVLSMDARARIHAQMVRIVGDVPIIILERGMTIGVIGDDIAA